MVSRRGSYDPLEHFGGNMTYYKRRAFIYLVQVRQQMHFFPLATNSRYKIQEHKKPKLRTEGRIFKPGLILQILSPRQSPLGVHRHSSPVCDQQMPTFKPQPCPVPVTLHCHDCSVVAEKGILHFWPVIRVGLLEPT